MSLVTTVKGLSKSIRRMGWYDLSSNLDRYIKENNELRNNYDKAMKECVLIAEDADKEILRIKEENKALRAQVERLRRPMLEFANDIESSDDIEWKDLYNSDFDALANDIRLLATNIRRVTDETPAQSLAEHDAEVIEKLAFPVMLRKMWSGRDVGDWIKQQAQDIRNQAKEINDD